MVGELGGCVYRSRLNEIQIQNRRPYVTADRFVRVTLGRRPSLREREQQRPFLSLLLRHF